MTPSLLAQFNPPAPVRDAIATINSYADDALNNLDDDQAEESLLNVLRMASSATFQLDRILAHSDILLDRKKRFLAIPSRVGYWPIDYNQVEDVTRYASLRIGYDLLDSKDPKRRSGSHVFKWFAMQVVERMNFIRGEALYANDDDFCDETREHWRKARYRESLLSPLSNYPRLVPHSELSYIVRIHEFVPPNKEKIQDLAPLSAATKKLWSKCGKDFCKSLFPHIEEISSLAKAIMDGDAVLPSQKRAQVFSRIGRAIESLN